MNLRLRILRTILCCSLIITTCAACGGDKKEASGTEKLESYTLGSDSAPALDVVLGEADGGLVAVLPDTAAPEDASAEEQNTEETDAPPEEGEEDADAEADTEEGVPATYDYQKLLSGGATANAYVTLLQKEENGFSIISGETPDFSQPQGMVTLAKDSAQEGNLFKISLEWGTTSCAVHVKQEMGSMAQVMAGDVDTDTTYTTAVETLSSTPPEKLGLETGHTYNFIPNYFHYENGVQYLVVRAYEKSASGTNLFKGTYYVAPNMSGIYREDAGGNLVQVS